MLSAEHRIEECLRRAKGEAGLAQYQVRTWNGWHHHQTLTLLATWFLTQEKQRGEKAAPCLSLQELRWIIGQLLHEELQTNTLAPSLSSRHPAQPPQGTSPLLLLEKT